MSDPAGPPPPPSPTAQPLAALPLVALPLMAIVGRPNVGKSALFNRIVGRRQAIVEDLPGTTRDRHYGDGEWQGRAFRVVDTGGLMGEAVSGPYATPISEQVAQALAEADAICFLVDVQTGLTPLDADIATLLREAGQPVYLAANKADNATLETNAVEFYALGLGEPLPISAIHGRGVAELLDRVVEGFPRSVASGTTAVCRLAIVGRPNVGKSSLVNAILQEERMIVSPLPGTTRDAIDTAVLFEGKRLVLVDTAGIRRRGRIEAGVERASVARARAAIDRADVAAVVLDAAEEVAAQDQHVVGMALEAVRGLLLVVNKVDLLSESAEIRDRRAQQLQWRARFVPWAPILWTSAITGEQVPDLLRTAITVAEERRRRVATADLNALVNRATIEHPPATYQGRPLRFYYATQADIEPPTLIFFVNFPQGVHFSFRRYLEGRIREEFGFGGVALRLVFRGRTESHG